MGAIVRGGPTTRKNVNTAHKTMIKWCKQFIYIMRVGCDCCNNAWVWGELIIGVVTGVLPGAEPDPVYIGGLKKKKKCLTHTCYKYTVVIQKNRLNDFWNAMVGYWFSSFNPFII